MTKTAVINICFKEHDGIVHAYSPDMPALHVCGKKRETVWADIPEVIRMLYKLNQGVDVVVHAAATTELRQVKKPSASGPVRFLAAKSRPEDRRIAA